MQEWSDADYYFPAFKKVSEELVDQCVRKHTDYGRSIGYHGALGLLPRMADKFFRLDALVWRKQSPNYESAIDSARDLASYAMALVVALEWEAKQNLLTCDFSKEPRDFNEVKMNYGDYEC